MILLKVIVLLKSFEFNISLKSGGNLLKTGRRKFSINGETRWASDGLSQLDLMSHDKCLLVDNNDQITGYSSKLDAHTFSNITPKGQLHRAFSVFLFREDGKMLIQQRATDKITFPGVWSNTCCSHQLTGCNPNEIDSEESINNGIVHGTIHAARRKLQHELGINPNDVPASIFKFLTRVHYCAKDSGSNHLDSGWGEHEIDYLLLARISHTISLHPNQEEVCDHKWVDMQELTKMMSAESGLLWSPWFKIIVDNHLIKWWAELDLAFSSNKYCEYSKIHRYLN